MNNLVQKLMDQEPEQWASILETKYAIKITRDGALASLKYNQLESPMGEPIVQQCRGMVVDTAMRKAVAWPYDKFWNHGDVEAAAIDWAHAVVQEKLDGSLMLLFWHEGEWRVASSGHPTAGGNFGADARTFREAFWQVFGNLNYRLPAYETWGNFCFMFELCDSPNRVVVLHEKPRLVLHGARTLNGTEWGGTDTLKALAEALGWEQVKTYPITSVNDCLAAAEALNPLDQEGFVVMDTRYNRVKIKSPRYVILHHMKGEITERRAIELWQSGEASELLSHFPELGAIVTPVLNKLDAVALQAVKDFEENSPRATRKEFAAAIKDRPWSAVLFRMLSDGNTLADAKAIMRKLSLQALERMVGA